MLLGLQGEAALLNKKGGILGHRIVITSLNDNSDLQTALSATQQLLSENKTINLFVPDSTFASSQLPFLGNVLSTDECPNSACGDGTKYPYTFTLNPPISSQIPPLVAYAKKMHYTSIGILSESLPDGALFTQYSKSFAAGAGIKVVDAEAFDPTATDVTSQLQKLRAAGAQVVFGFAVSTTIGTVATGLQSLGWKAPLLGVLANFTGNVNTLVPDSVKNQIVCLCYAVGTRLPSAQGAGAAAPLVAAMKPYGEPDSLTVAAMSADSLGLAAYGYEQAGTLDYRAAAKAIEQIGSHKVPSGLLWVYATINPDYTVTQHAPVNADFGDGFFAVVKPSPIVDGTYIGTPLHYTS